MRKAQMSLEMVIGLLILLVVVAVIIRIFLGQTERLGETKQFQETLKYREFLSKCEGYCNEFRGAGGFPGVQFCTSRLFPAGSSELGKKGIVDRIRTEDNILPITKAFPVCEDAVFCFQIFECKGNVGSPLDWPDCTGILCRYYYNITYKDWTQASAKVLEAMPNAGTCYIDPAENWWNFYFGSDPCAALGP